MKLIKYLPLLVIGIVLIMLCVLAWQFNKQAVAERADAMVNDIIVRTMPVQYDNEPHKDVIVPNRLDVFSSTQSLLRVYPLRLRGEPVATVLLPVQAQGYNGAVLLAVGIDIDGSVGGISVLSHQETSDIGDAAMKPEFTSIMLGKSLQSPPLSGWAVRRAGGEFDQISGATTSSSAIILAVRDALQLYAAEQERFTSGY